MSRKLSRRELLVRGTEIAAGLAAASTLRVLGQPITPVEAASQLPSRNQKPDLLGQPGNAEARLRELGLFIRQSTVEIVGRPTGALVTPQRLPYLPKTTGETDAMFAKDKEAAVFNRVPIAVGDSPTDRARGLREAVDAFGNKKGWGRLSQYQGYWFVPMGTISGDMAAMREGKDVQMGSSDPSGLANVRPLDINNFGLAMAILDQGNPKMALIPEVGARGQIIARLPQNLDPNKPYSDITLAFAVNRHFVNALVADPAKQVPSILFEGNNGGPIDLAYILPDTDNPAGTFSGYTTRTELEGPRGTITVDLPTDPTFYKGDVAPYVIARLRVFTDYAKGGETAIRVIVSADDKEEARPPFEQKYRMSYDLIANTGYSFSDKAVGSPLPLANG